MGTGSGNEGVSEKEEKYRAGWHREIPEPLSIKRNADLPILRKNASQEAGLQQENSMAVQHLY